MKSFFAMIVIIGSLWLSPLAQACEMDSAQFSTTYRNDINGDLNDLGRIFADSKSTSCAERALYALTEKVGNMLAAPPDSNQKLVFTRWLDGYYVALIYGAAFHLGEKGWASKNLDYVLDHPDPMTGGPTVADRFEHFTGIPGSGLCGLNTWNTCMDDHAGSAGAYAWMAAYKSRRPNHNTTYDINAAANDAFTHMAAAFASVCIRKKPLVSSATPVCNGSVTDLIGGTAETLSVNGTRQLPHYGFGLMTSLLSAAQALKFINRSYPFSTAEKEIAKGLFEEIRRHTDASGNFIANNCLGPDASSNIEENRSCAGPDNYVPNLYRLAEAYQLFFNYAPTDGYTSTTFKSALFQRTSTTPFNAHLSYGRYATYYEMGYKWMASGIPAFPPDKYDPIGFLEQVSSTGLAQGWACDKDLGNRQGAVKVDFYVNGGIYPPVASGWANSTSEDIINSSQYCNGGYAHRFWVQLPSSTKGKQIRAWALDYTWYGTYELPCLLTCSW